MKNESTIKRCYAKNASFWLTTIGNVHHKKLFFKVNTSFPRLRQIEYLLN